MPLSTSGKMSDLYDSMRTPLRNALSDLLVKRPDGGVVLAGRYKIVRKHCRLPLVVG